ncbi:MAG: DUF5596 domain-containing protein [Clostridia bacterium]|nr:DUF5596 domain-containing protein [Clostridia bacterium]
MRLSIDELMQEVNCKNFPERWHSIYNNAMDDFYTNGSLLLDISYYDNLSKEYGILVNHLEICKETAKQISKNEYLSAFLALLCYALQNREYARQDVSELVLPESPDGKPALAYDMLPFLAICSLYPYCYKKLKSRNLPEEIISSVMKTPELGIDEYKKRHNGAYGFHLLGWFQLSIDGRLFRIKHLEIELFSSFWASATVYKNQNGEYIALADNMEFHKDGFPLGAKYFEDESDSFTATISETDADWVGYPFNERGFLASSKVSLSKKEWKKVLSHGDSVLSLHIPSKTSFTEKDIDETLEEAKCFIKQYFPDFDYKAVVCYSWLMDPQLEGLLGDESNIVNFGKRFNRIGAKSAGRGVFYFIFNQPLNTEPPITILPERTRLERALKEHYMNNKAIYEMHGYYFQEE